MGKTNYGWKSVMNKVTIGSVALMLMGGIALLAFYSYFEYQSYHIAKQQHLAPQDVNSIKHAYTAALVYRALRGAGLSSHRATQTTLSFGMMNEYFERVVKYHQPDSMKEIMKDMYNNHAGVVAMRWHEQHHIPTHPYYASVEAIIGRMVKHHVVLATESDVHERHYEASSIPAAYRWAQQQQLPIMKHVHRALMIPKRSLAHEEKIVSKPAS